MMFRFFHGLQILIQRQLGEGIYKFLVNSPLFQRFAFHSSELAVKTQKDFENKIAEAIKKVAEDAGKSKKHHVNIKQSNVRGTPKKLDEP